ncbi:MAG: hydantoinase B/oxoprolinase family protein [Pseudomonadota bacterium]
MSDPVTLSVIQAGLVAAADEMFATLRKTAMSPIIYEVLDVGTGITDAGGQLVSSGAGIPTFVGVLDKAVTRILELHPANSIWPGDIFVTNDPYFGGVTHLSDVVIAQPVFCADRLVAWTASIAHWNDIGGMTPGSMSTDASEIYQEGLRLPAVKLFDRDRAIASIFDIITANSRQPDVVRGDLWAQVAASRIAAQRIAALVGRYGVDAYHAALADSFDTAEARARAGLALLPSGRFEIAERQDDGAIWHATVEIEPEAFTVDLRAAPDQRAAPYNTSRDGAVISAQMIFKALSDPTLSANAGSFRPLRVLTREGTIFHAVSPSPHGYYFETRIRLYDLLWRCLSRAMPERLPAGHFASICGTVLAGVHPDTGRWVTMVEPQMGGWGATRDRDGLHAMYSCSHGETFNTPVEIAEARYGLEVAHKRLSDQPPGDGAQSGGRGVATRYRMRGKAILSAGFSRNREPVWGAEGGACGGRNALRVTRGNGLKEDHAFVSGLELAPGDVIDIDTASGGGWGSAVGRD